MTHTLIPSSLQLRSTPAPPLAPDPAPCLDESTACWVSMAEFAPATMAHRVAWAETGATGPGVAAALISIPLPL